MRQQEHVINSQVILDVSSIEEREGLFVEGEFFFSFSVDHLSSCIDSMASLKNLYKRRKAMETLNAAKALPSSGPSNPSSNQPPQLSSNLVVSQSDLPHLTSMNQHEKQTKKSHNHLPSSIEVPRKSGRNKDPLV